MLPCNEFPYLEEEGLIEPNAEKEYIKLPSSLMDKLAGGSEVLTERETSKRHETDRSINRLTFAEFDDQEEDEDKFNLKQKLLTA